MKSSLEDLIKSAKKVIAENAGKREDGKVASIRTQEYTGQVISACCTRLHALGYYLNDIDGLSQKHFDVLVRDWHDQGLSNKTMQNQFSRLKIFCKWIGKSRLSERGGLAAYLPHVDPKLLKVKTVAERSKSWTENGIDIVQKIKEAKLQDERHAAMLLLGVAFGLRKKEMLRIKPWQADQGHCLHIDGSVAKNGRFRSIPLEPGEFGQAQRWALDEAKRVCSKAKLQPLGWPGLTYKQSENRYYHYMKKLGLTKFDEGVTGHGARAEYAENLLILSGIKPPTLGGTADQLPKSELQAALLSTQQKMGHNNLHAATAYFGSFRRGHHADGLGGRIGPVFIVDGQNDIFAMIYANPMPVKRADGTYKIRTAQERSAISITVVVEQQGHADKKVPVDQFIEQWPGLVDKVYGQLLLVGLGE